MKSASIIASNTGCVLCLHHIVAGELKPEKVITHVLPLSEAPKAYQLFNDKQDGCIKVVLQPGRIEPTTREPGAPFSS